MNLNQLLHKARNGTNADEDELFRYISERFHRFVQQRVQSLEDSEEIVQNPETTTIGLLAGSSR